MPFGAHGLLKTHAMTRQWTVEQVVLECVISALSVIVDEDSEP